MAGERDEVRAGPQALGRSLVVGPGAEVPAAWAEAPCLVVDAYTVADPAVAVEWLQPRWSARQRFVVELHVPIGATKEPVADDRTAWELGARFELWRDRLHHLIWSNAVDARDPGAPVWWWGRKALAVGGTPSDDADLRLPDGRWAWIDGGPLSTFPAAALDGAALVPGIAIERGELGGLDDRPPSAALAPDQLAAVAHRHGGARIVAPAGSGKTRVLTERARHLLADRGVPASALCLVAFNVRAAEEMRARTPDLPGLRTSTLNGLGLAILNGTGPFRRPAGRPRAASVADERAVRTILNQLVAMPRRANSDPAAAWLDALSAVRLGLQRPEHVEKAYAGETPGLAELVPRYRRYLADHDLVDFDDQITGAAEALAADPVARAVAQQACRVLLVDEFQDLTPAHVLLVRLLAAPGFDVFGVGDDDQTIYGYNGASPEWLIGYDELVPGAGSHALHVNYRCPPAVVRAAVNLLGRNRRRLPKDIVAAPGRSDDDGALTINRVAEPLAGTVDAVTAALAAGAAPGDIAVLSRVNASLVPVQVALADRGVPCTVVVDASFLERTGVRAALAWLRLATTPRHLRSEDLADTARRVAKRPSPRSIEWIAEKGSLRDLRALADRVDDERVSGYVDALVAAAAAARVSTAAALAEVRDRTGLGSAMDALDTASVGRNRGGHGDDLAALAALAGREPGASRFEGWLRAALAARVADAGSGRVTLSTVHRVKGQEWPIVVVHDAAAETFPHRLAEDVEEERRVFHVAITRAERRCVVVAPASDPSPFLTELASASAEPEVTATAAELRRASPAKPTPAAPSGAAARLFEDLKRWRSDARDGKPAYTVLANDSLTWIAERRPRTLAELARCPGVGPTKLERYGADILAVVERAGPP